MTSRHAKNGGELEGESEQNNELERESLLDFALRLLYNVRAGEDDSAVGLRLVLGMVSSIEGAVAVRQRLAADGRPVADIVGAAAAAAAAPPRDAASGLRRRIAAALAPLPTRLLRWGDEEGADPLAAGGAAASAPPPRQSLASLLAASPGVSSLYTVTFYANLPHNLTRSP